MPLAGFTDTMLVRMNARWMLRKEQRVAFFRGKDFPSAIGIPSGWHLQKNSHLEYMKQVVDQTRKSRVWQQIATISYKKTCRNNPLRWSNRRVVCLEKREGRSKRKLYNFIHRQISSHVKHRFILRINFSAIGITTCAIFFEIIAELFILVTKASDGWSKIFIT